MILSVTTISPDNGVSGTLDEMKATTTSFVPSWITRAGLNFAVVRSVKGKGTRTILPFIGI